MIDSTHVCIVDIVWDYAISKRYLQKAAGNPKTSKHNLILILYSILTVLVGYSPCDSGPCMNNGACYEIYGDQYYCECGPRYTGNACEIYSKYNS